MIAAIVEPDSVRLCGTLEIRFAPCAGLTMNAFGKWWAWMPCSDRIPSAQYSDSVMPSRPDGVEAGPSFERRADLEARRVDQAVEFVVLAAHPHPGLVDALDALAVGVDQMDVRVVVRLQVLVVEAGPLAQLAVPGLERLGDVRVGDDLVDAPTDLLHLLVVAVVVGPQQTFGAEVAVGDRPVADALGDVGPAVHHQVGVGEPAGLQGGEVHQPLVLPARLEGGEPLGVDRLVVADVDRRRRALEHEQVAGGTGEVGDALHRRGAGADDPDPLVGEADHRRAGGVAAGVGVVPAAGVEAVAGERLDARDAGQLRAVQRAGAHGEVLGPHLVAAVGADDPAVRRAVPLDRR